MHSSAEKTENGENMSVKTSIKNGIRDYQDKHLIKARRTYEINKFKDPRRIAIYSSIELSDKQKRQIDDLYIKNYGEKIPYIWHQHYTAFTGKFDPTYFPELLYIPEFEYFMNQNRKYCDVLEDKNVLSMIANGIGIRTPRVVVSSANGIIRDSCYRSISKDDIPSLLKDTVWFAKPTIESGSGKGCTLLNARDSNFGDKIASLGSDYVIQEKIICSDSIRALHPESVNTFRVMTYVWNGGIEIVPLVMRIGQGDSVLDNAHAGGMFIAIDNDGTLHDTAFTEFKQKYNEHPNTHIKFSGYKIHNIDKVIESAIKVHSAIPQIGVVNWDFTINKDEEPVLIEANAISGGIWLFQMAWGCGPFGDKTPEILRWIKKKKDSPLSRREKI